MSRLRLHLPGQVWLAAGLAAALRALPFLWTRLVPAPPGEVALPIGYLPKDWLQYAALIRQHGEGLLSPLSNPFTTEPQSGRFVLLFHQLLNLVHRLTGLDPFWLLELSRPPLLLLFFAVLWRFLGEVLPSARARAWACWLVAFSGGLEFLAVEAAGWLPPGLAGPVRQDLWSLYGWNTFETFYNPLWIAGLTLLLLVLGPALRPGGPRDRREAAVVGAGLLALWFVHPYSAMAAVAIIATALLLSGWLGAAPPPLRATATAVAAALLAIAAVTAWQLQDAVFRRSSGGVLGPQAAAVFWYPLTLGAVGAFALRGWSQWIAGRHPWRFALGGWTVAVALLHSSPLLNGYHFVMFLHLPVCVVAASALADWQERLARAARRAVWLAGVGTLLFASTAAVTLSNLAEAGDHHVPEEAWRLLAALSACPPGNVLAPPELGNLVPAYQSHRTFVGHWFLTPDFKRRSRLYHDLMEAPEARAAALLDLVERQRLDYLVVPTESAPAVARVLAGRVAEASPHGPLTLIRLARR